ncbi:MAG TPA: VanZ family protein [Blastocatellia bacterium]|nr:VanZ family protein [Blastocatellia bacterium]
MDYPTAARAPIAPRIIKYWLPVAAMLALMYYFSTDVFSAENTRSVIDKIFLWFVPHASKHALATLNYVVRKSAHFMEYAVLGAFLFRAYRADDPTRWRLKWALYSFLTAGGWALLDEFHQTLTRSRGGSIWDSLLDSSGAFFMLAAIAIVYRTPLSRASVQNDEQKAAELKSQI